jgi:AraC-like DNA-binding protein
MKVYSFNEFGQDRVRIYEINGGIDLNPPIRLHNYHLIMLTSGEITVDINFRAFRMKPQSSIHLSDGEIIRKLDTSKDVCGYHIVFSPEFQTEIRTTRKSPISIQLKKEFPYQEFSETEYGFLSATLRRLISYMSDPSHHYQDIVIKNTVHTLLLDISDKRRKDHGYALDNATHHEVIRERFKNLLEGHSDKQHNVSWYADALMISPDYLSKIIREYDGSSAKSWINASIVSKARFLMKQHNLSIKEISTRLNFLDQSSFGRFFKANTGQSPREYREKLTGDDSDQE